MGQELIPVPFWVIARGSGSRRPALYVCDDGDAYASRFRLPESAASLEPSSETGPRNAARGDVAAWAYLAFVPRRGFSAAAAYRRNA